MVASRAGRRIYELSRDLGVAKDRLEDLRIELGFSGKREADLRDEVGDLRAKVEGLTQRVRSQVVLFDQGIGDTAFAKGKEEQARWTLAELLDVLRRPEHSPRRSRK